MLKDLNEAIEHLHETIPNIDCEECRNEHKQLLGWLNELKGIKDNHRDIQEWWVVVITTKLDTNSIGSTLDLEIYRDVYFNDWQKAMDYAKEINTTNKNAVFNNEKAEVMSMGRFLEIKLIEQNKTEVANG